jgi:hypothetical protein
MHIQSSEARTASTMLLLAAHSYTHGTLILPAIPAQLRHAVTLMSRGSFADGVVAILAGLVTAWFCVTCGVTPMARRSVTLSRIVRLVQISNSRLGFSFGLRRENCRIAGRIGKRLLADNVVVVARQAQQTTLDEGVSLLGKLPDVLSSFPVKFIVHESAL